MEGPGPAGIVSSCKSQVTTETACNLGAAGEAVNNACHLRLATCHSSLPQMLTQIADEIDEDEAVAEAPGAPDPREAVMVAPGNDWL